ncbi:unnamed protein product [Rhizoctonia solani]|uniref:Uncharacterized protein n=1 Tax=Rhizoctonia solani TaxID=456999 RepID=A0A8H3BNN7_9AGAM|nr:unnamed protein product [Rhizoctonia solani]
MIKSLWWIAPMNQTVDIPISEMFWEWSGIAPDVFSSNYFCLQIRPNPDTLNISRNVPTARVEYNLILNLSEDSITISDLVDSHLDRPELPHLVLEVSISVNRDAALIDLVPMADSNPGSRVLPDMVHRQVDPSPVDHLETVQAPVQPHAKHGSFASFIEIKSFVLPGPIPAILLPSSFLRRSSLWNINFSSGLLSLMSSYYSNEGKYFKLTI